MIESLVSVVGQRGVDAAAFLLAFALTALTDSLFHNKLPHDHGREFAVNGGLSKGKARGSGLIFVLCIALVSLAFLPFRVEYVIYTVLLIASMLSGYFDDAAEKAWNEYKKGIIDFVIAVVAGVTYLNFNGTGVQLLNWAFSIPYPVYETLVQTIPEPFPVYITLDGDTVKEPIYVPVPITQKEYKTDDYKLSISGYKPNLDYIEVYRRTEYITKTISPRRWGIGAIAGYGIGKNGLSPYVGIGGFYRIW